MTVFYSPVTDEILLCDVWGLLYDSIDGEGLIILDDHVYANLVKLGKL